MPWIFEILTTGPFLATHSSHEAFVIIKYLEESHLIKREILFFLSFFFALYAVAHVNCRCQFAFAFFESQKLQVDSQQKNPLPNKANQFKFFSCVFFCFFWGFFAFWNMFVCLQVFVCSIDQLQWQIAGCLLKLSILLFNTLKTVLISQRREINLWHKNGCI